MTVVYQDDRGTTKTKNVMSFSNPAVYDAVQKLNQGDRIEVAYVEGDNYYNWASIKPVSGQVTGEAAVEQLKSQSTPVKSNWESAEERAKKQVYIIKQSCLAQAVAHSPKASIDDVLKTAQIFVDWVLEDGLQAEQQTQE
jgi:hypothetical protein